MAPSIARLEGNSSHAKPPPVINSHTNNVLNGFIVRIIPVIDLLNGTVVHAKQGQRKHYQPIVSSLTPSSKPLDIVKAFMEIYPFDTLYIADLNAIQRLDTLPNINPSVIQSIQQSYPELTIWLDAGIRNLNDALQWQSMHVLLVIGTESIQNLADYQEIMSNRSNQLVLSLDFLPDGYKGIEEFLYSSQYWPLDVIVMTLNHVGSKLGLAMQQLEQQAQLANHHRLYAAGGVRNLDDILQLKELGIKGALVATALHNGHIDSKVLRSLQNA